MKVQEFTAYLENYTRLDTRPRGDCISRCKRVEKHLGDLDDFYSEDGLESLLHTLTYDLNCIPINGDKTAGMASLKNAVKKYKEFRDWN